MDLSIVSRWQQGPDVEIFYNASSRHLSFKKHNFMYSLSVDDSSTQPYMDLQQHGSRHLSSSFSPDLNVLAFQVQDNEIVWATQGFIHIESRKECLLGGLGKRTVIGYH